MKLNANYFKTKALFLLLCLLCSGVSWAQDWTIAYCSNLPSATVSQTYGPMYSRATANSTSRDAYIYPASQLSGIAARTLSAAYFHRATATGTMAGTPNFKIYLKEVSANDWGLPDLDWATAIAGATLVYDSNPAAAVGSAAGWINFAFSTNFFYSGSKNLAVFTEYKNATASTEIDWSYEYNSASATCLNTSNNHTTKYANNTTGTLPATLTSNNYRRPYIGFNYTPLAACAGTPPTGATSVSSAKIACQASNFTLNLTGITFSSGLTYTWQSSPTLAGTYTDVSTASNTPLYQATATSTLYYRAAITCGANIEYSTPVLVTVPASTLAGGTYTINSTIPTGGTNFQTFKDAVDAIKCGIAGPVVFNVAPGTGPYNEQITIPNIPTTSATNTITFNGNGNTLSFNATDHAEIAGIKLDGGDFVTVNDLKITATGTTYGYCVQMLNNADNNTINNCTLETGTTSTENVFGGVIISGSQFLPTTAGSDCDNIVISNNRITGGFYGIAMYGNGTTARMNNCQVTNNIIKDFYSFGIKADGHNNILVESNDISRPTRTTVTTFFGVSFTNVTNSKISRNRIHNNCGGAPTNTSAATGIELTSSDATAGNENLISNNLIYDLNGASGTYYGIENTGSDYALIYHNTISLDHTAATGGITRGFYQTTSATGIEFKNNIISITRGGTGAKFLVYKNTAASTITFDNNIYYLNAAAGTNNFGFWGSAQANFAAWKTASSQDANSFEGNPTFTSLTNGNLIPTNAAIADKGAPLTSVAIDFTGAARSTTTPDAGGYELPVTTCTVPTGLTVNGITATGANLSWTAVGTGYEYAVTTNSNPPMSGTSTTAVTATSPTLVAGTTYYLHVRNKCSATKFSDWSSTSFTTLCSAPATPAISNITVGGATITWTGASTFFGYEYAINTSSTPPASGTFTTETGVTPTTLNSGTQYYVHLRMKCSASTFSGWSTVNFTTLACVATATPVTTTTFCQGGSVVLNANTGTGFTYQWKKDGSNITPGGTGASYTANTSGSYTVVVSVTGFPCSIESSPVAVTVNPLPTATITPASTTTFCQGGSVILDAGAGTGLTYQWKKDGTDITPGGTGSTYTATASGNYTVQITNSNTCVNTSAITAVTVNALPTATATAAGATTFCQGGSVTLNANTGTGLTYQWKKDGTNITPGGTGASYTANATGNYTVVVTNSNNCSATSTGIAVTSIIPVATATPVGSTTICQGNSVLINANTGTGLTYQWKKDGGDITPGGTGASYSATTSGNYTVTVTDANSCSATSSGVAVTVVVPTATATAAGNTTLCSGSTVTLNANTGIGFTYQWKKDGGDITPGGNSDSYVASTAGSYTVAVTNGIGCVATSTPIVVSVVVPTASITPAGPTTFCQGNDLVLNANTGTGLDYQWKKDGVNITPGGNTASYTANTSGNYTVEVSVTGSSCSILSAPVTVTVNPLPTATATAAGPISFCIGGSVVLNANTGAGLTYQWKKDGIDITPGGTNASYTANTTGSYTVEVKNSNNCTNISNAVAVMANPLPIATISPASSTTFCQGNSVTLNASTGTGYTYQWKRNGTEITPGGTGASFDATLSGNYTVVIRDGNNCSATSTATAVTVNALPTATIAASGPTSFCQGGGVLLNANTGAGLTYQWKRNGLDITPGGTGTSLAVNTSGSYTVQVRNANNCTNLSTATTVTVNPLPTATITPLGSTTICTGSDVTLAANTGANLSYQWKRNTVNIPSATGSTYTASLAGTYTVEVTNTLTNCKATSAGTIVTQLNPSATITPAGPFTFCEGGNANLSANTGTGLTYQWKRNGTDITGATNSTYAATTGGTYTVQVTLNGLCSATSAGASVTVNPLPTAIAIPLSNTTFCEGGTVDIEATMGVGLTYQWKKDGTDIVGATQPVYTAATDGSYTVVVTDGNTCNGVSLPVDVVVNPVPVASIAIVNGNTEFCDGASVTFDGTNSIGQSYVWQKNGVDIPGANLPTLTTNTAGKYKVIVTGIGGCSGTSEEKDVIVNPNPSPAISKDLITLTTANIYSSYQWYLNNDKIEGATDTLHIAKENGNYTIEVVDSKGCSGTSAIEIVDKVSVENTIVSTKSIRLYPNPTKGMIYIDAPATVKVLVTTVDGKMLHQQQGVAPIDIATYADGMYMIRVTDKSDRLIKVERVVKSEL
jgi:hypothetical protein